MARRLFFSFPICSESCVCVSQVFNSSQVLKSCHSTRLSFSKKVVAAEKIILTLGICWPTLSELYIRMSTPKITFFSEMAIFSQSLDHWGMVRTTVWELIIERIKSSTCGCMFQVKKSYLNFRTASTHYPLKYVYELGVVTLQKKLGTIWVPKNVKFSGYTWDFNHK